FPTWSPVMALHASAAANPDEVWAIMREVPSTNNDWVNSHLMDIALKLPPIMTASWAQREATRIADADGVFLWLPMSCRKVIEYLGGTGYEREALELAEALLDLRIVPDTSPRLGEPSEAADVERKRAALKVS